MIFEFHIAVLLSILFGNVPRELKYPKRDSSAMSSSASPAVFISPAQPLQIGHQKDTNEAF
jgi:hypothetical protein